MRLISRGLQITCSRDRPLNEQRSLSETPTPTLQKRSPCLTSIQGHCPRRRQRSQVRGCALSLALRGEHFALREQHLGRANSAISVVLHKQEGESTLGVPIFTSEVAAEKDPYIPCVCYMQDAECFISALTGQKGVLQRTLPAYMQGFSFACKISGSRSVTRFSNPDDQVFANLTDRTVFSTR